MDTIEVKMQESTKKRAGRGDDGVGHRGKRRATTGTTSPRLTRAMLKKLNKNGGTPVELDPGLDMGVRRRAPRKGPPKRPAPDEAVVGSVKRTSTTRSRKLKTQPTEPKPTELQTTEPQSAKRQPTKSQPPEAQPTEPRPTETECTERSTTESQPTESQPVELQITLPSTHPENRVMEADVVAASRLAQAAIAAGLTGSASEAGSPVTGNPPDLLSFTKKDLRNILSDAIADDGIRQKMEPHWLARTEFLTWWDRPAADMGRIKDEVRRLAIRWGKDLQTQTADDVEIPLSMLESWRADIAIVAERREGIEMGETVNKDGTTGDDHNGDGKEQVENKEDGNKTGPKGEKVRRANEQNDKEKDEEALAYDSREVAEALTESATLAARDMEYWKEAFDKEMAAEPSFRSKRAWAARISHSQKEATALEERVWGLDVHESERATKSTMQAANNLLDQLQKFRVGIRMDREAFWDELDQEGAELLLANRESEQIAGEDVQEKNQEIEAQNIESEEDAYPADICEDPEDVDMADIEGQGLHGSSNNDGSASVIEQGPTEQAMEVVKDDSGPKPTIPRPDHVSEENTTHEGSSTLKREEPTPAFSGRATDMEGTDDDSKTRERSPSEAYTVKGIISIQEEKHEVQPAVKLERHDREGGPVEAMERSNSREPTPWLPDKKGSRSSSWEWPHHQREDHEVVATDDSGAVEQHNEPSDEARRDTTPELFSSRSASAEQVSNEEEHASGQALNTSEVSVVPQDTSSTASSIHPRGVDGEGNEIEDTAGQSLTTSNMTSLPQDTGLVASSSRSASLEVFTGKQEDSDDGSSTASNISSLPEDARSATSGRSETVEETDVQVQTIYEVAGSIGIMSGSSSSPSNIASLLQELTLPQDTKSSTGAQSQTAQDTGAEPEVKVEKTSSTDLSQVKSPTTPGIRSGSDTGVGGGVEDTVHDHAAPAPGPSGPPRGGSFGEDLDAPLSASLGESPVVVPTVRYIKPQWESLFSPEEPTFTANDYSANEIDDEDQEDDDMDEADDRETDDVDP